MFHNNPAENLLLTRIRLLLGFFMIALFISGLTAIPLIFEINLLNRFLGLGSPLERMWPAMARWISFVHQGLNETWQKYPFMLYGTDWLAFAHIVIGIAFWGPFRDPVRNRWVIELGMIACVLVIPTALIFGALREIPFFWRLLDCSFGVFGILPLWFVYRDTHRLEELAKK
jgi:hypothetical protein